MGTANAISRTTTEVASTLPIPFERVSRRRAWCTAPGRLRPPVLNESPGSSMIATPLYRSPTACQRDPVATGGGIDDGHTAARGRVQDNEMCCAPMQYGAAGQGTQIIEFGGHPTSAQAVCRCGFGKAQRVHAVTSGAGGFVHLRE